MDLIHFEKQEGMLCAQHALNALLQGPFFTVLDLAEIARQIDAQEQLVLSQPLPGSASQGPSHNMDDSGFFSVQVMQRAVGEAWNLSLVPFMSRSDPSAVAAQRDPTIERAYICNFREHWFAIRKIGLQWFNLNSNLRGPELVSDTHLSLLLTQLQNDGYSIFIVRGTLPECEAEQVLLLCPLDPKDFQHRHQPPSASTGSSSNSNNSLSLGGADPDIAAVLQESREEVEGGDRSLQAALAATASAADAESVERALAASVAEQERAELDRALALSLDGGNPSKTMPSTVAGRSAAPTGSTNGAVTGQAPEPEDLRRNRAAFLDRFK